MLSSSWSSLFFFLSWMLLIPPLENVLQIRKICRASPESSRSRLWLMTIRAGSNWPPHVSWNSKSTGIFWGEDVDVLQLQPRNRTIFSLKNKTLIADDFKAQFLGERSNPGDRYGIQVFGFNATPFLEPWPARFTATKACDSYGRRFLRLGGPDGKFHTENYALISLKTRPYFFNWLPTYFISGMNSFGIERERPNSSIYFRLLCYIPTRKSFLVNKIFSSCRETIVWRLFWSFDIVSVKNVTLVVKPVPPTKISFDGDGDGDNDDVIFT